MREWRDKIGAQLCRKHIAFSDEYSRVIIHNYLSLIDQSESSRELCNTEVLSKVQMPDGLYIVETVFNLFVHDWIPQKHLSECSGIQIVFWVAAFIIFWPFLRQHDWCIACLGII